MADINDRLDRLNRRQEFDRNGLPLRPEPGAPGITRPAGVDDRLGEVLDAVAAVVRRHPGLSVMIAVADGRAGRPVVRVTERDGSVETGVVVAGAAAPPTAAAQAAAVPATGRLREPGDGAGFDPRAFDGPVIDGRVVEADRRAPDERVAARAANFRAFDDRSLDERAVDERAYDGTVTAEPAFDGRGADGRAVDERVAAERAHADRPAGPGPVGPGGAGPGGAGPGGAGPGGAGPGGAGPGGVGPGGVGPGGVGPGGVGPGGAERGGPFGDRDGRPGLAADGRPGADGRSGAFGDRDGRHAAPADDGPDRTVPGAGRAGGSWHDSLWSAGAQARFRDPAPAEHRRPDEDADTDRLRLVADEPPAPPAPPGGTIPLPEDTSQVVSRLAQLLRDNPTLTSSWSREAPE